MAWQKGLGLGLAFEAEFESLPATFSIVADISDGGLHCLLELCIMLVRSFVLCIILISCGSVSDFYFIALLLHLLKSIRIQLTFRKIAVTIKLVVQ